MGKEPGSVTELAEPSEMSGSGSPMEQPAAGTAGSRARSTSPKAGSARARSGRTAKPAGMERPLDVLHDVRLTVQVVLGEITVPLRELLGYEVGQVVSLDRQAGTPAEVVVNGRPMFRGEIVVADDEYAVRITELINAEQG
jgi:flagellar motor switch protein FliN/FliY